MSNSHGCWFWKYFLIFSFITKASSEKFWLKKVDQAIAWLYLAEVDAVSIYKKFQWNKN